MSQQSFDGFGTMRRPMRDATMLRDFPQLAWKPPSMGDLPSWRDAKDISIDIETCDPNVRELGPGVRRKDGYIAGVSFAIEDGPSFYLPIRHEMGPNLPEEAVKSYLRDNSKIFRGTIIGANLGYDLDFLWEDKIDFPDIKMYRDVLVTDVLIDELQRSYSLDAVAARHGLVGKDQALLFQVAQAYGVDPKRDLHRLPAAAVGPYAEQDARLPLLVRRRQEKKLDEAGLWEVYDLESELLPVLLLMRRRGTRINLKKVEQIERWTLTVEAECAAQIRQMTGVQIKVGDFYKSEVLAQALRAVDVPMQKTPKGKDSVKNPWLRTVKHPIAKILIRAREFSKLRTMFCKQARQFEVNGRVHPTFGQVKGNYEEEEEDEDGEAHGTRFGRCFSKKPNFQFQPTRNEEFGDKWRDIYEAEDEDEEWVCIDLSQQEPRLVIHYAELCGLPRAKEAGDRYRNDPATDNHQMLTDWILEAGALKEFAKPRNIVKNIYNGLSYGMGEGKLCRSIGREPIREYNERGNKVDEMDGRRYFEKAGPEEKKIFDLFHEKAPFVRMLAKLAMQEAERKGYVRAGIRHCHFEREGGRIKWGHKALNRIVQGEAANQTKAAMVRLHKLGIPLRSTVHDEVNWSQRKGLRHIVKQAKWEMEHVREYTVPSLAQVEIGPTWGTVEKVSFD